MFPTAYTIRPSRRLFSLIDTRFADEIHADWLEELGDITEIIWLQQCTSYEHAINAAARSRFPTSDFLFLNTTVPVDPEERRLFFERLSQSAEEPDQLLLPALQAHWDFMKFLTSI
jgi:hypothetical protein